MHKRGLRTSWTVHYVDGYFELPSECVKYILIRDKLTETSSMQFYHHISSERMFRSLVEVEKFIKYEIYPPKPRRPNRKCTKTTIMRNL
ncbi:hypothetical protein OSB04_020604 [Centaurea solstitialis]|uniref:Uncharacterized protein n=1 Tax=Centaurea solstitialis TaxID=347529 RepID=A0AA38WGZ9_9ASTR|nr:hypothetical protein OSB04_020604 [Centaurea solstitialis]